MKGLQIKRENSITTPKKVLNIGSFNASNGYDPYGFKDMAEEDDEDNRS